MLLDNMSNLSFSIIIVSTMRTQNRGKSKSKKGKKFYYYEALFL